MTTIKQKKAQIADLKDYLDEDPDGVDLDAPTGSYFASTGLPREYRKCSLVSALKDAQNAVCFDVVKEYIDNFDEDTLDGRWYYLSGETGVGKTYMMSCIINEISTMRLSRATANELGTTTHVKPKYLSWGNFIYDILGLQRDWENHFDLVKKTMRRRYLFIDELALNSNPTPTELDTLYQLLNYRKEHCLPTFFASNVPMSGLSDIYGDRIADRFKHCVEINIEGKSRRQVR